MSTINQELRDAKDVLANEKMLCSDATENNRNTIFVAILAILHRLWRGVNKE